MKAMIYLDEDGIATERSQAVYDARMQKLLSATFMLSCLGFGAAILNGEYAVGKQCFVFSLEQRQLLCWSSFLWPSLCFQSLRYHWKDSPISTYNAGLIGSLLSGLIVYSKLLTMHLDDGRLSFTTSLASFQIYAALILAVIQILFPRRPDLSTKEGKLVDLEGSSSAFHRYSMRWCLTALALAGHAVPLAEFPVLNHSTRSKSQSLLVVPSLEATLWDRILAERYVGFAKQWAIMLVRSAVTFVPPYCVMRLLKSLEDNGGQTGDAWIWLIGIGASSVCHTIIHHHLIWIQWSEMGIPVRAQLIMAIFQKALRRKDSKAQQRSSNSKTPPGKPDAINLISLDTISFSKFTAVNYIIPATFVRFFFAVLFLWNIHGWQSTLVALSVTMICVPLHNFFIKQQREAQKKLTAARDKKTKMISEALHALRQIKFSASEAQWEERIQRHREEEITQLRRSFAAKNIRSVWGVAAPLVVAAASIFTFTRFQGVMAPSIVFPMIKLLPHLQETLAFFPVVFQDYLTARSNARRMDDFMRRPEQQKILSPSPSGHISFRGATIAWPTDEAEREDMQEKKSMLSHGFSLHSLDLEFPVGELSIITGKTGSGKSLLLAAMIGEAELLQGRIEAPSVAEGHPVAFVSQTPWLQNATIKDNILFGSPFDKARYEGVLTACALGPDLVSLEQGDETRIGSRGVKLSGGQRVRLALGRALYSSAQLLVLDDIFSALDASVSKEIFNALTGELGKGRTRVVVTHQASLCLPKTKYIVHLRNNTVDYAGNADAIEHGMDIHEAELRPERKPSPAETREADFRHKTVKPSSAAGKAKKHDARTDMNVYKRYFAAAGGIRFTFLFILGLIIKQLLDTLSTWLLGRVSSSSTNETIDQPQKIISSIVNVGHGMKSHFYLYLWSCSLVIALEFLINMHTFSGSVRTSKTLFRDLTFSIMRVPIFWLDTTPFGEMLKVFTVDTRLVDDLALITISEFADCIFHLVTVLGAGFYTSMYTSLLIIASLFWCAQVSRAYIKARSTVKRADSEPTADILEHFTSSTTGISTIRAFGAVDKFVEQMHWHLDRLSTAKRHFWIFNRWIGLEMSFVGILFSTGTGAVLLSRSVTDTALVGFCLTFSMEFSRAIFKAVNNFAILETCMNATGAVTQYIDLEIEKQGGIEISDEWPSKGEIEVKDLAVAYSIHLPLVLEDVSLSIKAGQRVGIVGRTGAGKSSLTLSLLRLLEPRSGSIHIDGIDISTIRLKSLRSRIAFVPQDPVLFSGTVRSNLDYFKGSSESKLKEALRRVELLAEEGDDKSGLFSLDSIISAGGANMSQGQRQLLCLARVLLRKPKVMILDEATSAVDNKTDLLIQDTLSTEFSGTLLVVAHRLRTIASFDQVIVMSNGKILEAGKPSELLKRKGAFYSLVQDSQDKDSLTSLIL